MNVPDYVSPIVAYRAWKLGPCGLQSSSNGEFWHPNQTFQAVCKINRHTPPHSDCSCGIYAAKSFDELERAMWYAELEGVCGEVYLWGTIVEHNLGWRAQFAYPKTLVVGPENLLFGRLVQRDPTTEELESLKILKILTAYGADLFVAGEKGGVPLWTKECRGFDHVRQFAAKEVVTVAVAVLMEEDWPRQRLLQNGVEINNSAEITFTDAQFPLSPKDPVLHQIQHRNARVLVIDFDRTRILVAFQLCDLIRRMYSHIAVFLKTDGVNTRSVFLSCERRVRDFEVGLLSCRHNNTHFNFRHSLEQAKDVLSAYNSLKNLRASRAGPIAGSFSCLDRGHSTVF
jgi:hypothetical protein